MNKTLQKIFIIALVLVTFLFVSQGVLVTLKGRTFVKDFFLRKLNVTISLDAVGYRFPFGVACRNIHVPGLFDAKEATIQWSIVSLFRKETVLSSIYIRQGLWRFEKDPQKTWSFYGQGPSATEPQKSQAHDDPAGLLVRRVRVVDSRIVLVEHYDDGNRGWQLDPLDLKLDDVHFPLKDKEMPFFAEMDFASRDVPFLKGHLSWQGRFNWVAKNMDAELTVVVLPLKMQFEARTVSQNDDMLVKGRLSLYKKEGKPSEKQENGPFGSLVAQAALKFNSDIEFHTRMSRLDISHVALKGNISADAPKGFSGEISPVFLENAEKWQNLNQIESGSGQ